MKYPAGKTPAQIKDDVYQEPFKRLDVGYIDGYVRGGDNRPVAVFVRESDGYIGFLPTYQLQALFDQYHPL